MRVSVGELALVVTVAYRAGAAVVKLLRGKRVSSRRVKNEGKETMEKLQALTQLRDKLAGAKGNPIILMLLTQLDTALIFIAGQAPEKAEKFIQKAAQTALIWVEFAEEYAVTTETPWDDVLVKELRQTAEALTA